jgi:Ca-activated chloride channel homolog
MIEFTNDKVLPALLIIPFMVLLFLFHRHKRKRALKRYAAESKHLMLLPEVSAIKPWLKHFISMLAFMLLIIALSGPRVGSRLREVEKQGREIVIALDVSYSMLASDVRPNRLEMAKTAISRLFERLEDDKVGLIVFAGDAYTQIPLTNDFSAAKVFLASAGPGSVSKQGTSIAAAINLAMRSFSPTLNGGSVAKSRAIIIITDGEDHEAGVIEAAEEAVKQGIVIHTVGIGDPDGVPIPLSPGTSNFRRDKDGNVVVSKLDEKTLTTLADMTGGFYIRAGRDATGLFRLISRLDELEKQEFKVMMFEDYEERFQYFIGFAVLLLLIDFFINDKRNRWLSSLKIFD